VRRLGAAVFALALALAVAFLAAAAHEVGSLGAGLTRITRNPGLPTPPGRRPDRPAPPPPAGPEAGGSTSISFTATEGDLARVLRSPDVRVGGWLTLTRDVACRLTGDRILIETRNGLGLFGVTAASYSGLSGWALAALRDGVGVKLTGLRIAGVPVPGASWLLRRLGRQQDGWVVVRPGSRATIERIEVADGKLTVVGTVRGRAL
jgi:hypothetical protein